MLRARIVIAEEQHLVRAGIQHCLARVAKPRFEVVAETTTVPAMLGAVERHQPDLLILDVMMGERSALEALAHCVKSTPNLAVVVLSDHTGPWVVREALALGALGYVLKDAQPSELVLALQLALRGASYLAPGLAKRLPDDREQLQVRALTLREREVVRLLALGYTFPAIARMMNFSERTVKNYRASAAAALGITTRVAYTLGGSARSARQCGGRIGGLCPTSRRPSVPWLRAGPAARNSASALEADRGEAASYPRSGLAQSASTRAVSPTRSAALRASGHLDRTIGTVRARPRDRDFSAMGGDPSRQLRGGQRPRQPARQ